jgi:predicted metalloprotease with PDZ domain
MKYGLFMAKENWLQIECEFQPKKLGRIKIALPIWRPGRYQVQNFAKNIPEIKSYQGDKQVSIAKIESSVWELNCTEIAPIKLVYTYFAVQRDAGGSVATEEMLYINFVNCLVCPQGFENQVCDVTIKFPSKWQFASSLTFKNEVFCARSYRELADSPFLAASKIFSYSWSEAGALFFLQGIGPATIFTDQLIAAYQKIVAFQCAWMGKFPVKKFHFLLWICPEPFYHGVEHTKSTMMVLGPEDRACYEDLIGLASHEFFHVWNIATIRPKELLPYRFGEISYFDSAWIVEGVTTYLGDWFLKASGVITEDEYLNLLLGNLKLHFDSDRFSVQSLTQSSMDLWLDGYGTSTPGKRVSIYFKGAIIALGLDFLIVQKFNGTRSLKDVMQKMNASFGNLKKGYFQSDFFQIVEEVYEAPLSEFWDLWVLGSADLLDPLASILRNSGLELSDHPTLGLQLSKI